MANLPDLYKKAVESLPLGFDEALRLYRESPLTELMSVAHDIRQKIHPGNTVTWQIDRNVNITNVCVSGCKFCTFHCKSDDRERAYITSMDQYRQKIREMQTLGGEQLLLQGGLHPRLDLAWYEELFSTLKQEFPNVKLHALGPPEIAHLARISGLDYRTVLERLIKAGLDSFPGAGAEILDNDIRKQLSPGKCSADVWMEVMREAHRLGLHTSATMMYGHIEKPAHRILHLLKIRDLQEIRPEGAPGFLSFIPWPYQGPELICDLTARRPGRESVTQSGAPGIARRADKKGGEKLKNQGGPSDQVVFPSDQVVFPSDQVVFPGEHSDTPPPVTGPNVNPTNEFLRMIAISRIVLNNVPNIQASWLTTGLPAGQMALHGGANDMGSIMIEENVVSSTGKTGTIIDAARMQDAIRAAGFEPRLRNQRYELL